MDAQDICSTNKASFSPLKCKMPESLRTSSPFPMDQIAAPGKADAGILVKIHPLVLGARSVEKHEVACLSRLLVGQNESGGQPPPRPFPIRLAEGEQPSHVLPMLQILRELHADAVFGGSVSGFFKKYL